MATTITNAVLTVNISENISLNGSQQGSSNTFAIPAINEIFKRIVSIEADDDATVAVFKSTVSIAGGTADTGGDGALKKTDVKYIRITNLDDTNSVNISLQLDSDEDNSAADLSITYLLEKGRSFIMGSPDEGLHADDDALGIVTSLTDVESIIVDPGSNVGTVEVFIASA
mgnify:CR=1 FL=1|tara:strand:+ start:63 stop:575 length:513 start_codon:yes stop_codon:yes gene_type:complete